MISVVVLSLSTNDDRPSVILSLNNGISHNAVNRLFRCTAVCWARNRNIRACGIHNCERCCKSTYHPPRNTRGITLKGFFVPLHRALNATSPISSYNSLSSSHKTEKFTENCMSFSAEINSPRPSQCRNALRFHEYLFETISVGLSSNMHCFRTWSDSSHFHSPHLCDVKSTTS